MRPSPELILALREASGLLLLLDYDGTLVPFAPTPEAAAPDEALLGLLGALAARPGFEVHLVSGRPWENLEAWFGALPVGLHGEHGLWSRPRPGQPWAPLVPLSLEWKARALPLLEQATLELPGAHIEEKSATLAWHYRQAAPSSHRLEALTRALEAQLSESPVEILHGDKVLEIRLWGVHKGRVVAPLLAGRPLRVLALGDDRTDEDLFAALPEEGVAVHVGPNPSRAPYRLEDPAAARAFLESLIL